jgi:hypothetical protein
MRGVRRLNSFPQVEPVPSFEPVLAWPDYYDGPRRGVAIYHGQPHLFVAEWAQDRGQYADTYLLTPLGTDDLTLVLESWEIWRRWARAFPEGQTVEDQEPVLPADQARWEHLSPLVTQAYKLPRLFAGRARAVFRRVSELESYAPGAAQLEVSWTDIESPVRAPHPASFD